MGGRRRPGFRHPDRKGGYEDKKETAGSLMQSQHVRKNLVTKEGGEKSKKRGRKNLEV